MANLPDREILKARIEQQNLRLCEAQALIACIKTHLGEGVPTDRAWEAREALNSVLRLVGEVNGYLDDDLWEPAEAQEVDHG